MVDQDLTPTALQRAYAGLQDQLQTNLQTSRTVFDHPVAKGSATEWNWLKMLQSHLPHRYQAETAFVIDANGQQSDQMSYAGNWVTGFERVAYRGGC